MTIAHPRIGMDRYVDADWMELAANVVRGDMAIDGLHDRLAADIPGQHVRKKAIGILNRMWFPHDADGRDIAANAATLCLNGIGDRTASFEAVSIAAYPFFRNIVEHLGRLLRLQGACTAGEVHRRMFEQHGKRSTIDQATSYGFKTMSSWGMIERLPDRKIGPGRQLTITEPARRLLDLAANRSRHSVSPLHPSDPILFPYKAH